MIEKKKGLVGLVVGVQLSYRILLIVDYYEKIISSEREGYSTDEPTILFRRIPSIASPGPNASDIILPFDPQGVGVVEGVAVFLLL